MCDIIPTKMVRVGIVPVNAPALATAVTHIVNPHQPPYCKPHYPLVALSQMNNWYNIIGSLALLHRQRAPMQAVVVTAASFAARRSILTHLRQASQAASILAAPHGLTSAGARN